MKEVIKYRCGSCECVHDDEWGADDCCKEPTEEVVFYNCDECGQEFESKKEAFEHCNQTQLPFDEEGKK